MRWLMAALAVWVTLAIIPSSGLADVARTQGIVFHGDSVVCGSDDNPIPPDNSCGESPYRNPGDPGTPITACRTQLYPDGADTVQCANPSQSCSGGGARFAFMAHYAEALGFDFVSRKCLGGMNVIEHPFDLEYPDGAGGGLSNERYYWTNIMHESMWNTTVIMSLYTNDVKAGGCTVADVRSATKQIVDHYLTLPGVHVYWHRSPASHGKQNSGVPAQAQCDTDLFADTDGSLRDLFLGTGDGEYGNEPRVHYTEELYRQLSAEPNWWYAFDNVDADPDNGTAWIHPNSSGYAKMAGLFCNWIAESRGVDITAGETYVPGAPITGGTDGDWSYAVERCNEPPAAGGLSLVTTDTDSVTLNVTLPTATDGDTITGYVWLGDQGEDIGAYPSHDRTSQTEGVGSCINAGCVAAPTDPAGGDLSRNDCGTTGDRYCNSVADKWLVTSSGQITVNGLADATTYTAAIQVYDGKELGPITELSVTTGTPPPAAPGIEQTCTNLGDTCLCSTPLNNATWLDTGWNNYKVASDPADQKLCYNATTNPTAAIPNTDVGVGASVVALPAASADLPATASGINFVGYVQGNTGGVMADAGKLINDLKASRTQARTCMRTYFRYAPGSEYYAACTEKTVPGTGCCNQKMLEFKGASNSLPRVVLPWHWLNGDPSPAYSHDIPNSGGQKESGWASLTNTNGFETGGTLGMFGTSHCFDHWCRVEVCLDAADIPDDWTGLTVDERITVLSPEGETFEGIGKAYPDPNFSGSTTTGPNFGLNLYFPCLDDNDSQCSPVACDLTGSGRYFSHVIYTSYPTASGQWPGPACEMEGGC